MIKTDAKSFSNDPSLPIWRDYLELTKPKVVLLMLITSIVGMLIAPNDNLLTWEILFFGNLGIALAAGSAAVINHLIDRHIDAKMGRTSKRPLPKGRVQPIQALVFSLCLCVLSMLVLLNFTNRLTTYLTLASLLGYAVFYTVFLKHLTPQNIVIGGATGAAPPLLGWTAVTNSLDPNAWLLVIIIFVWTPPHFWSLAIHRYKDYEKAGIPMLPVTHGIPYTKMCITLYTSLLLAVTLLPFIVGMSSYIYLASAVILGGIFISYALKLQFGNNPLAAINSFKFSSYYLLLLFIAILLDHFLL